MTNKYLVLKFKNARLFPNRKTKDKILDTNNQMTIERTEAPGFKEPITVFQISNVLHALFGERPVPTLRNSLYPKVEYYFDKAEQSFLKLEICYKTYANGSKEIIKEKLSLKKSLWNSWNPSVQLNWEMVKLHTKESFDWFITEVATLTEISNPLLIPFNSILEIIRALPEYKLERLYSNLLEKKIGGVKDLIKDNKSSSISSATARLALNVVNGIDDIQTLKGSIVVPVNEKDIEVLSQHSKGFVTILDGGMVWIHALLGAHEISLDDYLPVQSISLEKYEN